MPESIAFVIGMAMENYWDVKITQYDDRDYKYVLNMKDIKYYD
jgi:nitrogen fixation-related uncharacterized protein